jgi:DNA polymerase/3'-5' exonuclease PolX
VSATNQIIAERLREAADLLEQQAANPFRVRAYREAAKMPRYVKLSTNS